CLENTAARRFAQHAGSAQPTDNVAQLNRLAMKAGSRRGVSLGRRTKAAGLGVCAQTTSLTPGHETSVVRERLGLRPIEVHSIGKVEGRMPADAAQCQPCGDGVSQGLRSW